MASNLRCLRVRQPHEGHYLESVSVNYYPAWVENIGRLYVWVSVFR